MAWFLIFIGTIAFAFLIYSILNMKKLNIGLTHPRIIVEFTLTILGWCLGIFLLIRK